MNRPCLIHGYKIRNTPTNAVEDPLDGGGVRDEGDDALVPRRSSGNGFYVFRFPGANEDGDTGSELESCGW